MLAALAELHNHPNALHAVERPQVTGNDIDGIAHGFMKLSRTNAASIVLLKRLTTCYTEGQ